MGIERTAKTEGKGEGDGGIRGRRRETGREGEVVGVKGKEE